ncbi:MAG: chorismate synthase, partial [Spirochaetales bacterium]|nr:chorismate synthase [Spirochaetales bacterium]
IEHQLSLRRPLGAISTARVEADRFQIVSGVFNGRATGTPLCILIPNTEQRSKDYSRLAGLARPGHADYTAQCKYHGFQDYRGGGHFSGRLTAALVAAGGVVIPALKRKGIFIGTHVSSCAGICDTPFSGNEDELNTQIAMLGNLGFGVLDEQVSADMRKAIEAASKDGDSVGGVLETAVTGLPAGLGEPWFDSIESLLSHALFSIPAIKGVQFGAGFDKVNGRGSDFNDPFGMKDGRVVTRTNNNGGINGGITNGMPVVFRCAVKPTPSIYKEQDTVDFLKGQDARLAVEGRHDPAIVHRARIVVDSVVALVLYDVLVGHYGTDFFAD